MLGVSESIPPSVHNCLFLSNAKLTYSLPGGKREIETEAAMAQRVRMQPL